jgi:HlyD family secretion protein
MKRLISVTLVALLVGGGVLGYLYAQSRGNAPKYRLARLERGPLAAAVSSTGNLNAVMTVLVGSQVSGQIKELMVDFNSPVRKDQVIAQIDPDTFRAKVDQARAELEAAQASVLNQQAQVEKSRADVEYARGNHAEARAQTARSDVALIDSRRDYDRKTELFKKDLIAKSDRDTSQATLDQAVAQLDASKAKQAGAAASINAAVAQLRVTEAMLQNARATVKQKQAALDQAKLDLDHSTIRSPVNGVVVSRAVDVGQTVAASLQAPTLFTIAQDLTKMQVDTSVDEADIGRVREGGQATFTVDAFPGQTFRGTVVQIRKAPQVVQNVVTYTVVVNVDNTGGRLLPGMTANVRIVTAERENVLKVPNAALRFRPPGEAGPGAGGQGRSGGGPGMSGSGSGGQGGGPRTGSPAATVPGESAPSAGGRGGGEARGAGDAQGGGEGRGGGAGRQSLEAMRERLVTSLQLTDPQQKKLDPILQDSRQQMRELQGLPDADRQAKAQKIRETTRGRIREILTTDQRKQYDQAAAAREAGGSRLSAAPAGVTPGSEIRPMARPGRIYVPGLDGAPKAVPVTLGITDGSFTEVVQGEIPDGAEVIVGQAGAAGRGLPGPGGSGSPRLRL